MDITFYDGEFGPVTRNTRIAYTGGTFDIFHLGHVNLLQHCRKIVGPEGLVIVGLNTDEFIREYKGEHPINDLGARVKVLSNCRLVDAIIPNTCGTDSKPAILRAFMQTEETANLHMLHWFTRFVVIGSDWATRDYHKQMDFTPQWLAERDITLCYVPYTPGISSTKLRKYICD